MYIFIIDIYILSAPPLQTWATTQGIVRCAHIYINTYIHVYIYTCRHNIHIYVCTYLLYIHICTICPSSPNMSENSGNREMRSSTPSSLLVFREKVPSCTFTSISPTSFPRTPCVCVCECACVRENRCPAVRSLLSRPPHSHEHPVCVCVCVRERERENRCSAVRSLLSRPQLSHEHHVCVCVCVCNRERERIGAQLYVDFYLAHLILAHLIPTNTLCVCVWVCVCERERERIGAQLYIHLYLAHFFPTNTLCVCLCVCVCV